MGDGGARRHAPAVLPLRLLGLQNRSERLRRENENVQPLAIRYTDYYISAPCYRTLYVRPRFMPIEYCDINTLVKDPLYVQGLK